jgi:hypothetical protein
VRQDDAALALAVHVGEDRASVLCREIDVLLCRGGRGEQARCEECRRDPAHDRPTLSGVAPKESRQSQTDRHEKRRRRETRPVTAGGERPRHVPEPVGDLERRPRPGEGARGRPSAADGTDEAPDTEGHQRNVEDDEADAPVGGYEPADETGRREDVVEPRPVLLDRVRGLGQHEGQERETARAAHRDASLRPMCA